VSNFGHVYQIPISLLEVKTRIASRRLSFGLSAAIVLVLVTSSPANLLPTVRSRCQSLTFSPVPQSRVREYLEQEKGLAPEEARLRAALVPGSIGRALSVDLDEYGKLLEQVVEALRVAQQGPAGVVAAAESLSQQIFGHRDDRK